MNDSNLDAKRERLLATIRGYGPCVVAFSGGVDSAVVAKAARLAHGDDAVAVTSHSASLAEGELDLARRVAKQIGVRHEVIQTDEFDDPAYVQNAPDRCYHCKSHLYDHLDGLLTRLGAGVICNGANTDDLGDYRPGMIAASEHSVRSPLAECEISKSEVRELARAWDLPVWDKPAAPCLSSRVAYGEEVTPERLKMVDQAEQFLRSLGAREARVRYHRGDLARLEIPAEEISRFVEPEARSQIAARLREIGFKFITLDIEGFRSGSLNSGLPSETLHQIASIDSTSAS